MIIDAWQSFRHDCAVSQQVLVNTCNCNSSYRKKARPSSRNTFQTSIFVQAYADLITSLPFCECLYQINLISQIDKTHTWMNDKQISWWLFANFLHLRWFLCKHQETSAESCQITQSVSHELQVWALIVRTLSWKYDCEVHLLTLAYTWFGCYVRTVTAVKNWNFKVLFHNSVRCKIPGNFYAFFSRTSRHYHWSRVCHWY